MSLIVLAIALAFQSLGSCERPEAKSLRRRISMFDTHPLPLIRNASKLAGPSKSALLAIAVADIPELQVSLKKGIPFNLLKVDREETSSSIEVIFLLPNDFDTGLVFEGMQSLTYTTNSGKAGNSVGTKSSVSFECVRTPDMPFLLAIVRARCSTVCYLLQKKAGTDDFYWARR